MRRRILLALVAVAFALPQAAFAQASGSIQATANVLTTLNVTGQSDLQFIDVLPGVNQTVLPTDGTAGEFRVSGAGTSEVTLDFQLPADLAGAVTAATMPIVFDADDAGFTDVSGGTQTTFDPNTQETTSLVGGGLWVYLGGTVQPSGAQAFDLYSATVTLNVAYTGN